MKRLDIEASIANVNSLNLDFLVDDLVRTGVAKADAALAVEHYRQFLAAHAAYPTVRLVPTKLVDKAWHAHMLRPMQYNEDCMLCFGRIVDHTPGVFGTEAYEEAYAMTRRLVAYGAQMPVDYRADSVMAGADCWRREDEPGDGEWPPLNVKDTVAA